MMNVYRLRKKKSIKILKRNIENKRKNISTNQVHHMKHTTPEPFHCLVAIIVGFIN